MHNDKPVFPKASHYKFYRNKLWLGVASIIFFCVCVVAFFLLYSKIEENNAQRYNQRKRLSSRHLLAKKSLTRFSGLQASRRMLSTSFVPQFEVMDAIRNIAKQDGVSVSVLSLLAPTKSAVATKPKAQPRKTRRRRKSRVAATSKSAGALVLTNLVEPAVGKLNQALTLDELTLAVQSDFSAVLRFYADVGKNFPGLFVKKFTLLPVNEKEVALQVVGAMILNQHNLNSSQTVNTLQPAKKKSTLDRIKNPFSVPVSYQKVGGDDIQERYLAYANKFLHRGGKASGHLLTFIMRDGKGYRAIIGSKSVRVGDKVGQLNVTAITSHSVVLSDQQGALTLKMSGLNTFVSKL